MEKKNIIFIGPGKSGTTYIYNLLKKNGYDVGKIKESNYFLKGEGYWESYTKEYSNRIIDFSNTYFWNPNIALKINEKSNSSILVVLKRDPYDRLASHLNYLLSRGEIERDWRSYLKNNRDIFMSLSFDWYLSMWQEHFNGRMEVIDFNDLKDKKLLGNRLQELGLEIVDWDVDKYRTKYVEGSSYTKYLFTVGRMFRWFMPKRLIGILKANVEPIIINLFARRHRDDIVTREEIFAYLND